MLHNEGRVKGKVRVSVLKPSGMLKQLTGFWVEMKCDEIEILQQEKMVALPSFYFICTCFHENKGLKSNYGNKV